MFNVLSLLFLDQYDPKKLVNFAAAIFNIYGTQNDITKIEIGDNDQEKKVY